MRRSRMTQAILVSAAILGGLLGLAINAASAPPTPFPGPLRWIQDNPWQAMIVLVVVAVVMTVVLEARSRSERLDVAGEPSLAQVADLLASAVAKQWQDEAQMRRLNDPHPLPVAWYPADMNVVEPWDALRVTATSWPGGPPIDPADWAASPAELAGADKDLADRLARIPTGRLIVLGEPGAGKTMLLIRLVLELLARRHPGDPVPVLVPLAGWNPVDQDFPTWLAARLAVDHPGLAEPASPEATAANRAQALWQQRLLLPILDGFDELPEVARSRAVSRLNDALSPRQGLVLASRVAAYRHAVTPTDLAAGLPVRLWGAAGIVIRPLAPDAVRDYLRRDAASPAAAARWDPVLATLGTSAPVAQALTTPLLVALARTIYNPRPGEHTGVLPDPAELCDTTRFPTPTAIQAHLFDAFIPAAYRPHPDPARRCSWTIQQAERWLEFLARHLENDRQGTTDLAWWELRQAVHLPLLGLEVGLVVGLIGGLAVGLAVGFQAGFGAGMAIGLATGLAVGITAWILVTIGRAGFTSAPARGIHWRPPGRSGLEAGLVAGLGAGLVIGIRHGFAVSLGVVLAIGLAAGLAQGFAGMPADLTVAAEPRAGLARDRSSYWTLGLVVGVGTALAAGLTAVLTAGLGSALVVGLVLGLVVGLVAPIYETAWGGFVLARCWLAVRRRLPWRLMSFLADAHQQRGVLRQAGAVYQFRHADLQHRLGGPTHRIAPSAVTASTSRGWN